MLSTEALHPRRLSSGHEAHSVARGAIRTLPRAVIYGKSQNDAFTRQANSLPRERGVPGAVCECTLARDS